MIERERIESGDQCESAPRRALLITALGLVQILMWGSTFYLLAVLAPAIVAETGWPERWVISGITVGLITAGLISPRVGRAIDRRGGRPVLVFSSILTACGFVALALAWSLPVYLLAWVVLGIGMGTGLYDAVFAALGRLYGAGARSAITSLTLFGGFGSTVCWPLSAWLLATWDWRVTCLAYAAIHLAVSLPVHALMFPAAPARHRTDEAVKSAALAPALAGMERVVFGLLAGVQMLAQAIGAIVIVYLLVFLQARGLTLVSAVALGTLFGPAQVGARIIERLFGANYHPIWTMIAAAALMSLGLALLLIDLPVVAAAVVIYGAGYGVTWIARGTLPLALFGPERYPVLIGRLALPSIIAPALAPAAGALMIERVGVDATIAVLTAVALANVGLVAALWAASRARRAAQG
jgi:MFS family permease